jgi:hypothetical protein
VRGFLGEDRWLNGPMISVDPQLVRTLKSADRREVQRALFDLVQVTDRIGDVQVCEGFEAEATVAKMQGDVTIVPYTGPRPYIAKGLTPEDVRRILDGE